MEMLKSMVSDAVNGINLAFIEHGRELYNIDPNTLLKWHKIYECMDKRSRAFYKDCGIFNSEYCTYNKGASLGSIKMDIDTFDAYIQSNIYEVFIYEPDIENLWKTVKETLQKWIENKQN